MTGNPKILIFTDWFLPAYKAGGPIRSVANIVEYLNEDFTFYIATSDRDLGDDRPYSGLEIDKWLIKDFGNIIYLSPTKRNFKNLGNILREVNPDVVYLNSMFSLKFTILPLVIIKKVNFKGKVVLAPRGMLGAGALGIKPVKKNLFLKFGKLFGVFSNINWHATSVEERKEIELVFGLKSQIKIAKNIPREFLVENRKKESGFLDILFYSRISMKKNLLEGLRMLEKGHFDGHLVLEIVGPIESQDYWQECQRVIERIETSKNNVIIKVIGAINSNHAQEYFERNHLFFLPTRHENFGHVIAEALSSSMPVLLSDQTPWVNIKEEKAGFDLSINDEDAFVKAINQFLGMDQTEYDHWSKGARDFFDKQINLESIVNETRSVFLPL